MIRKTFTQAFQNKVLTIWFYDDESVNENRVMACMEGNGNERIALGVRKATSSSTYTLWTGYNTFKPTAVERSTGWHQFVFDARDAQKVIVYIDGVTVAEVSTTESGLVNNAFSRITLGWWDGAESTRNIFDDIAVTNSLPVLSGGKILEVISAIDEIGEITLDKAELIRTARDYYDNLNQQAKQYITNYNVLVNAETQLRLLEEEKALNEQMAAEVGKLIEEIGEVTLDSKTAIEAARAAYDALTDDQKPLVENYDVLTAAEAELARLEAEAKHEADLAAAEQVDEMIERLFPVNRYSGPAIRMVRAAYEALTEDQKTLVKRYDDLVRAEKEYAEILPLTPSTPAKPSQKPDTSKDNLPFTDVTSGSWYYDGVKYACNNGLMNGTSANEFNPNANTTRSMIVTILARMEGVNSSGGATWYAAGREWAMGAGISDGTNMTDKITREQLAAMLYRYAKLKGYDVSASADISGYTDASSVSSWATDAMRWAVGAGLINGRTATTLAPQGNATRAEVASILMRFMQKYTK